MQELRTNKVHATCALFHYVYVNELRGLWHYLTHGMHFLVHTKTSISQRSVKPTRQNPRFVDNLFDQKTARGMGSSFGVDKLHEQDTSPWRMRQCATRLHA